MYTTLSDDDCFWTSVFESKKSVLRIKCRSTRGSRGSLQRHYLTVTLIGWTWDSKVECSRRLSPWSTMFCNYLIENEYLSFINSRVKSFPLTKSSRRTYVPDKKTTNSIITDWNEFKGTKRIFYPVFHCRHLRHLRHFLSQKVIWGLFSDISLANTGSVIAPIYP